MLGRSDAGRGWVLLGLIWLLGAAGPVGILSAEDTGSKPGTPQFSAAKEREALAHARNSREELLGVLADQLEQLRGITAEAPEAEESPEAAERILSLAESHGEEGFPFYGEDSLRKLLETGGTGYTKLLDQTAESLARLYFLNREIKNRRCLLVLWDEYRITGIPGAWEEPFWKAYDWYSQRKVPVWLSFSARETRGLPPRADLEILTAGIPEGTLGGKGDAGGRSVLAVRPWEWGAPRGWVREAADSLDGEAQAEFLEAVGWEEALGVLRRNMREEGGPLLEEGQDLLARYEGFEGGTPEPQAEPAAEPQMPYPAEALEELAGSLWAEALYRRLLRLPEQRAPLAEAWASSRRTGLPGDPGERLEARNRRSRLSLAWARWKAVEPLYQWIEKAEAGEKAEGAENEL